MREIVHIQAGQCGNQIGAKVSEENIQSKVTLKNAEFDPKSEKPR